MAASKMGLLNTFNKTEIKEAINFIDVAKYPKGKCKISKVSNGKSINFKLVTSPNAGIASLTFSPDVLCGNTKNIRQHGSKVMMSIELLKYYFSAQSEELLEAFIEIEDKYGANAIMDNKDFHVIPRFEDGEVRWYDKQSEYLKELSEEHDDSYVFSMRNPEDDESQIAIAWDIKDAEYYDKEITKLIEKNIEDLKPVVLIFDEITSRNRTLTVVKNVKV